MAAQATQMGAKREATIIDERCRGLLSTLEYGDSIIYRLNRVLTMPQPESPSEKQAANPPTRPCLPDVLEHLIATAANNNKMLEYIVNKLDNVVGEIKILD